MLLSEKTSHPFSQHIRHIVALFCFLCAVYFLTFSGKSVSNDEDYLIDSMQSFFSRGVFDLTYFFDLRSGNVPPVGVPFPVALQEPLHSVLALPFYALGYLSPVIGMMHTTWLFNIMVVALTACVVYFAIVLEERIPAKRAFFLAALFGISTLAWPYATTFFREPLSGFFLTLSFVSARRIASKPPRVYLWVAVCFLAGLGVLLTKVVLILAVLCVILLLIPLKPRLSHALIAIVLGGLGVGLLMAFGEATGIARLTPRYFTVAIQRFLTDGYFVESLAGYLISPGRSFFLYSPVLIFSLYGSLILWRRGEKKTVIVVWMALILLAINYSVYGAIWWGGNGWGPRYLLPIVPMFFLISVPAILKVWERGLFGKISLIVVSLISIAVQVLGTTVSFYRHYGYLTQHSRIVGHEGIWLWDWSPIPIHFRLWNNPSLDVAWSFTPHAVSGVIVLCGVLLVLSIASVYYRRVVWGLPLVLIAVFGLGLYQLRDDSRYAINQEAPAIVAYLQQHAQADDIIFLQVDTMRDTFLNGFKRSVPVVTLAYAEGENFNPDVHPATIYLTNWSAQAYGRIWLITDANPTDPNELRVTERYLLERFYPVSSVDVSPFARVILFDTTPLAPPEPIVPVHFGEEIALTGLTLPNGLTYQAGESVPVSLAWMPLTDLADDYLISVQIAQAHQPPINQYDGLPNWGFARTSRWNVDTVYPDYYALAIPEGTPSGQYYVQIILYQYPTLQRLSWGEGDVYIVAEITVLP
jgi:hypothetical protein